MCCGSIAITDTALTLPRPELGWPGGSRDLGSDTTAAALYSIQPHSGISSAVSWHTVQGGVATEGGIKDTFNLEDRRRKLSTLST